jgi:hypothetical protein
MGYIVSNRRMSAVAGYRSNGMMNCKEYGKK